MYYEISKHVRIGFDEAGLCIGFGSRQLHSIKEPDAVVRFLHYCCEQRTLPDINTNATKILGEDGLAFVSDLLYKNILSSPLKEGEDRFSRPKLYYQMNGIDPERAQQELSTSSVVLIGSGGIGNLISLTLATAGVGKLTLVDDDDIELSNLSRQWAFTEKDIGKSKVKTLQKQLHARNSNCEIVYYEISASKENLDQCIPRDTSLVVVSADGPGIVGHVSDHCVLKKIPFINVGYVNDIAAWGPFYIPGNPGCHRCLPLASKRTKNQETNILIRSINDRYQPPSTAPINMMASAFASNDILLFLSRSNGMLNSLGKRVGISPADLIVREIPTTSSKDGKCKCTDN